MKSMTGYGKASILKDDKELTLEIKSVNNRFLEISAHFPKCLNINEEIVRKYVKNYLNRGSVDIYLNFNSNLSAQKDIQIDIQTVKAYLSASEILKQEFGLVDDLTVSQVMHLPDVFKINASTDEDWNNLIIEGLTKALEELEIMRINEGKSIYNDLIKITGSITELLNKVSIHAPQIVKDFREKISARITELLDDKEIDETRLLNEVAFFADKADINEEISRMCSHIEQFLSALEENGSAGRKLDFISQEMTREVNTMCSKCNDIIASKLLIEMKNQIEKLKEQIRNVE